MSLFIEVLLLDVVLSKWKRAPSTPRHAYPLGATFADEPLADKPFSEQEIRRMKHRFKKIAPTHYAKMFGGESSSPN